MIAVTHVTIVEQFMHIITELVLHMIKHAPNVIAVIITAKFVVVQTNINELMNYKGNLMREVISTVTL